ncbi:hypothetical protein [Phytohabitans houttuyneae]|uniref:Uncharacterized protein n=1 Tax=Phytohabitans houttuyneae TaxID=1076126 RepID=A0A6V8KQ41_9ACTN|nr:hypothetical protein [Phytohabitans houttuyneae]GFJ83857.1 hypothetical protein Phou_080370 [Phytohabitans houttuyneae]
MGEERYEACYRDLLLAFRDWVGGAEPDGLLTAEDGLKALESHVAGDEVVVGPRSAANAYTSSRGLHRWRP